MTRFRRLLVEGLRNPGAVWLALRYLPQYFKLFSRLMLDARMPLFPKLVLLAALLYLLSPLDFLPDFFIPFLGYVDDLFVLIAALRFFLKKCPPDLLETHLRRLEVERNG